MVFRKLEKFENRKFGEIEHSETKIIMNFEDEVGHGVVQSSVQQILPGKNSRQ